jgi:hypothetical protein
MNFRLDPALLCCLNQLGRLSKSIQSFFWLRRHPVSLRKRDQKEWHHQVGTRGAAHRYAFEKQRDALL